MSGIKLEAKLVGDIRGVFCVPTYQRGFRWGEDEVVRLLNDIYGICNEETRAAQNYCLQPVVVKRRGDVYELIDGQQRLTTLYLLYKYMNTASMGFIEEAGFALEYETRPRSAEFLRDMDMGRREENIDFWFMANAYETIKNWFSGMEAKPSVVMNHLNTFLAENVKVIWYEVGGAEDAVALFTRLNIGKIPLTSAELVRAMFLSSGGGMEIDGRKQEEIALQWDNIEKELHSDALWYFLTNSRSAAYQTRIDLILDLIAKKPEDTRDKYYTFFRFDQMHKQNRLTDIWREITHTFLILKDWFGNHELYHKVGYLIASGARTLAELYRQSKGTTKREFLDLLDGYIRESIDIPRNYGELSYDKPKEYAQISRLLLLFNVESVRKNGERTQWFPFEKYKYADNGKVLWSLEHIHAQMSEGLRTQEEWREWLKLHIRSVETAGQNKTLADRMREAVGRRRMEREEFAALQKEVFDALSVRGSVEYLHSISNLALLNCNDNAALSNATFDVKRNVIIEMDKRGEFIPFCTKMVFLKYYTPSEENQLHFWGQADRIAYVDAMNEILGAYLREKIMIDKESNT